MASGGGGSPGGRDRKTLKPSSLSEPRPKKRPVPRFDTSFDTELSLNTEMRRAEDSMNYRSLPNNLGWSLGANGYMPERGNSSGSQRKSKHFEQVKLPETTASSESPQPAEFKRKKHHTPATIPRTKLPAGTPIAERLALERLRQHLVFGEDELPSRGPSTSGTQDAVAFPSQSSAANNERAPLLSRPGGAFQIPVRETNETDITQVVGDADKSAGEKQVDASKIIERLKQVRDFLKQATGMFVSMSTGGSDEQRTRNFEQAAKLARLIKNLKKQEKAYTSLLQRSIAVEDDSATENTPSLSLHSFSEDEKSETHSARDEELQGLRQQHALLHKMLEQQKQLKELQTRQAALLTLQRDAEQRLAEAEEEDGQTADGNEEGAIGGGEYDTASGTEASEATAEGSTDDWGFTPEQFALHTFMQRAKEKFRADEEKDRDEGSQRKRKKNQQEVRAERGPAVDLRSSSDVQPDNEEAALAIADAAQERLELENKLMALQAKKEQMDSLLRELQQLREAQLKKESLDGRKPHGSSINEAKQDNDDEKPLATTSQKLDDDSILEALEVHEKLRRLQDVRQHLKQLRDMIGHYQESAGPEGDLNLQDGLGGALAEDSAPESGRADEAEEERGAVGGVVLSSATGPDNSSMDWILNYGIDDPELIGRLRQLQAARERVLHLKQTNQMAQLPVGTSRLHNETSNPQLLSQSQTEDSETDGTTTDDTESNASHASSSLNALAWQDDPEFQEKITKLNSAKKKLKQLQELVKRVQQFPDGAPVLPTELAELSFDEVDDDDDEDDDDDDDDKEENSEQTSSSSDEEEEGNEEERNSVSEQEAEYQLRLQKQKNELDRLLEERRRLLEMQQQLSRLTQQQSEAQKAPSVTDNSSHASAEIPVKNPSKTRTSNSGSPSLIRTDTFTVNRPSIPVAVKHVSDSATQTQSFEQPLRTLKSNKSYSLDSGDAPQGGTTSSALVWSELRRQRELHEEKLKKRKHRLLNEKRKKAGLDDVSEGGAYSLRSADVDEGFGVSMMSADITTATWGGSTQPSSTQNDSAVSEDESEEENQEGEIAVEVEDDYPDGIVQAEEEEEERDEQDTYPGGAADVFRSRERVPRNYGIGRSLLEKKRSRGARKKELSWPKIGSDRSPRQRLRQQNFTPAEQLIEEREREQFILERQAWEQQCGQLHEEVAKLTNMCNNLLRDQQSLITALIGRNNLGAGPPMTPMSANAANDSNPFQQYQQKQQEAYQSLQSYFENQRHLLQQQQLVQTLNQCYMQLNNQQQDLNFLQGKFQQLFSCNSNPPSAGPSPLPRYDIPGPSPGYPFAAAASNLGPSSLQPNGMPSFSFSGPSNTVPTTFPSLPVFSSAGINTTYSQPTASRPSVSHNFTYSPFQTSATANDSLNHRDIPWPVAPSSGQASAAQGAENIHVPSWVPVFSDTSRFPSVHTQTEHAANPETGVPSPRFGAFGGHTSSFASTPGAGVNGLPSISRYGAVRFPSVHTQTEHAASSRFGAFGDQPSSLASTAAGGVSGLPSSSKYGDVTTSTDTALLRSYDPSAYAEASTSAYTRPAPNEVVVGRSFPTPLRAQAVANLANKDRSSQTTKPTRHLKRGFDSVETSSQTSSVPGEALDPAKRASQDIDRASDAGSEFSLFEALRDSIYSEVATLISLNESRPHFLIELFRELQLLTSDYLRQRALYALRDIVTRFLTEDSLTTGIVDKTAQQTRFQAWVGSNSELTPSETVETSEDENGRDEAVSAPVVTEGIYDYVENVESGSTLSTPTSSQTGDAPFASEGLGETVIHFDEALHKMRQYEQLRAEGKLRQLDIFASSKSDSKAASDKQVKDDVTTSSAGDMGSDSSFSDIQYPRIDTQALDHQIKSIMSEVIPYLNEHMEDTCTAELMGYIRGLVLSRIRVREEQEFGRFFHKQLASILHDSLSKFEGRKMKDCGEDMLVDMSEILFNELAFFRLMQDLDGSGTRGRRPFWRQEVESGTDTGTGQEADKEDEGDVEEKEQQPEDSATEETESTTREKPEDDKDENKEEEEDEEEDNESSSDDTTSSEDSDAEDEAAADDEGADQEDIPIPKEEKEAEEEELGKDRDDDMAAQFEDMPESSKEDASESQQCVKLELSVSESKPFASAGSGEEDGEESYDDLQSKRTLEECEGGTAAGRDTGQGSDSDESDDSNAPQDDQAQGAAQATRPEHLQNGQLTEDHDDFEVILDDLPTKLTGLTEADLQARIAEEQSRTEGAQGVLRHIDAGEPELAGDGNALREPEPPSNPVNDSQEGEK